MNSQYIINADDCGYSRFVDERIEASINMGRITSTTIMANMDDFDGAVKLYKQYSDLISFGWHLNLTEGTPLLYSQILLDYGFYIETDHGIQMNGQVYKNKWIPKTIRKEIIKELEAQFNKICDSGITISHVDSHHHIHTSIWAIMDIPDFLNKRGVRKIRRIYNNVPQFSSSILRDSWALFIKSKGFKMPDVLCSFIEFYNGNIRKKGEIVEVECHPGNDLYVKEEELLLKQENPFKGVELTNFNYI